MSYLFFDAIKVEYNMLKMLCELARCMSTSNENFSFGKNWLSFLSMVNEERIQEAEKNIQKIPSSLKDKIFLDAGCGSGLFSLAAARLGARVISFDLDADCIQCAEHLKKTYASGANWTIQQGSVLDLDFLKRLEPADIIYSWGVLHHTGNMYKAFENLTKIMKPSGHLFISIYNDQGKMSQKWKKIKASYNKASYLKKMALLGYTCYKTWGKNMCMSLLTSGNLLKGWRNYEKNNRGMSAYHDLIDWVAGYPFEVARPEDVVHFFSPLGYQLQKMKTCGAGLGCNEFVFLKLAS